MSGTGIEDTAELQPARRDLSWFALALAALAATAFVGGAYLAARSMLAARTPEKHGTKWVLAGPQSTPIRPQKAPASTPNAPAADGYMLLAATTETPPPEPPVALPASAQRIFIHYSLPDWPASVRPEVEVQRAGEEAGDLSATVQPQPGSSWGRGRVVLVPKKGQKGFAPGIYLVRLFGPEQLEEVVSFVVLADLEKILGQQPPAGGLVIVSTAVAPTLGPDGTPKGSARSLSGAKEVYFWFAYDAAVDGTAVEIHWFLNGKLVPQASSRLRLKGGSGTAVAYIRAEGGTLPPGNWSVGVYLEGSSEALAGEQFTIGGKVTNSTGPGTMEKPGPGTRPG